MNLIVGIAALAMVIILLVILVKFGVICKGKTSKAPEMIPLMQNYQQKNQESDNKLYIWFNLEDKK
jgi:hypothetical protein